MVFLFVLSVLIVIVIVQFARAHHPKREVVRMFTGTIGAGKSFKATKMIKFSVFINRLLHCTLGRIPLLAKYFPKPVVFSTTPLNMGKTEVVPITRDDLLLKHKLYDGKPCVPIVYLDEFGLIANQNDFDDKNIMPTNYLDGKDAYCTLEVFIRFFRHIYGEKCGDRCRIYLTDQSASDVVIGLRRRLGNVYELSHFRRWLKIMPFYKIDVRVLSMSCDEITNTTKVDEREQETEYFFGWLPYRWMNALSKKGKCYDSHCYSLVADKGFSKEVNWHGMKTEYIADVRQTSVEKAYTKAKEKYLNDEVRKKYNMRMDELKSSK